MIEPMADDFEFIARRSREISTNEPIPEVEQERKPWCNAIHTGCDYPDCPCGIP